MVAQVAYAHVIAYRTQRRGVLSVADALGGTGLQGGELACIPPNRLLLEITDWTRDATDTGIAPATTSGECWLPGRCTTHVLSAVALSGRAPRRGSGPGEHDARG